MGVETTPVGEDDDRGKGAGRVSEVKYSDQVKARGVLYGYTGRTKERNGDCPRKLGGKRHSHTGCWCGSPLNDHGATWTRHGERVVLWEPAYVSPVELVRIETAAKADGLWVQVHALSPHSPGHTVAIEFAVRR